MEHHLLDREQKIRGRKKLFEILRSQHLPKAICGTSTTMKVLSMATAPDAEQLLPSCLGEKAAEKRPDWIATVPDEFEFRTFLDDATSSLYSRQ